MKSNNYILRLAAVTLSALVLASCSDSHDIKIIQEDDPNYLPFDAIEYISIYKDQRPRFYDDLLAEFYTASDRGRNSFNYRLYINESGKCEKIKIEKGLDNSFEEDILNSIGNTVFEIGMKDGKAVQYKTNLTNKWLFGFERDYETEKKIEIITLEDPDYPNIDPGALQYYLVDNVFETSPLTQKIIGYNREEIIETIGDGTHHFFYRLFVNEKGEIDKIKILKGMGAELDKIIIGELPIAKANVRQSSKQFVKFSTVWNVQILIEDSRLVYVSDAMLFSNTTDAVLSNIKDRQVNIVSEVDTSYVGIGWLDRSSFITFPNFIPVPQLKEKFGELFTELGRGEYQYDYVLHINEEGLVDKVKIENGMGKKYDALLISELNSIVGSQGILNGEVTKYRGVWSLHFKLGDDDEPQSGGNGLMDARRVSPKYKLSSRYNENEFTVLPSLLPHPVGGIQGIADKIVYPEIAKDHGIQGRVLVKSYIDEDGDVIGVQVLEGIGYNCESAAVDAIRGTSFEPGFNDGQAVKSYLIIPVEFSLEGAVVQINKDDLPIPYKETFSEEFVNDEDFELEADVTPFPVGGLKEIQKKIVYPSEAKEAEIQGKVFINAFVNSNGDVVKAEVIRGIGGGCDEAALNAVKQTRFSPGFKNGQPVNMQITVPILFRLQ